MEIIEVNKNNISLLKNFTNNKLPNSFRYFNKRPINIIENHILTILLLNNNIPIGYGHIDFEDNKYWLGICILEEYQGKGNGKKIMDYLLNNKKIDKIYLTVDKNNINAIKLYKKYNFNIIEEFDTYFLMLKNNTNII